MEIQQSKFIVKAYFYCNSLYSLKNLKLFQNSKGYAPLEESFQLERKKEKKKMLEQMPFEFL